MFLMINFIIFVIRSSTKNDEVRVRFPVMSRKIFFEGIISTATIRIAFNISKGKIQPESGSSVFRPIYIQ